MSKKELKLIVVVILFWCFILASVILPQLLGIDLWNFDYAMLFGIIIGLFLLLSESITQKITNLNKSYYVIVITTFVLIFVIFLMMGRYELIDPRLYGDSFTPGLLFALPLMWIKRRLIDGVYVLEGGFELYKPH